jgi:hypothetical protein
MKSKPLAKVLESLLEKYPVAQVEVLETMVGENSIWFSLN